MVDNKRVMSQNIMKQMLRKGVTATQVCDALGFKKNTFSDWINRKSYPRIDKIEKMANYFGVSKADLVEEPKESFQLSKDEMTMLYQYRNSDETTKNMIHRMLTYNELFSGMASETNKEGK